MESFTEKTRSEIEKYNTQVIFQPNNKVKPLPFFIIDLTGQDGYQHNTLKKSESTNSLPMYRNLVSFFMADSPPTYTEATGKELKSHKIEKPADALNNYRLLCCCKRQQELTKCDILLRFIPLLIFIVIFLISFYWTGKN